MRPFFRPATEARAALESIFPELVGTAWHLKSPYDDSYQCIAWSAGATDRKWWPTNNPQVSYWPEGVPVDETVQSFVQAFATLGYKDSQNAYFKLGFQKVAIYASSIGLVRHMARQHFLGRGWLSKPGSLEDLLHPTLESIEGDPSPTSNDYGVVVQILERSWWTAARHGLFKAWRTALKFWIWRIVH